VSTVARSGEGEANGLVGLCLSLACHAAPVDSVHWFAVGDHWSARIRQGAQMRVSGLKTTQANQK